MTTEQLKDLIKQRGVNLATLVLLGYIDKGLRAKIAKAFNPNDKYRYLSESEILEIKEAIIKCNLETNDLLKTA